MSGCHGRAERIKAHQVNVNILLRKDSVDGIPPPKGVGARRRGQSPCAGRIHAAAFIEPSTLIIEAVMLTTRVAAPASSSAALVKFLAEKPSLTSQERAYREP